MSYLQPLVLEQDSSRDFHTLILPAEPAVCRSPKLPWSKQTPGCANSFTEASFSQVITKDRLSQVNPVSAGRPGFDRALLQSPRLTMTIDALLRVYDHVLLDAGGAYELPAALLSAQARAVLVPDAAMDLGACRLICDQLKAVGFTDVAMLRQQSNPPDQLDVSPMIVAA